MAPYRSFNPDILRSLFDLTVHLFTADRAFPDARLLCDVKTYSSFGNAWRRRSTISTPCRDDDFLLLARLTLQHFQRVSSLNWLNFKFTVSPTRKHKEAIVIATSANSCLL
jgi:hypothetical protein